MDATFTPYSVCMSVYKNDNAAHFLTALRSMSRQTIPPDEIVLVVDGPIGERLEGTIAQFSKEYATLQVIRFAENRGHAAARQAGIDNANNELIAIMDSDDIALPNRMEMQLTFMAQHPEIDVLGGQIEEFIGEPSNVVGKRIVPTSSNDIKYYLRARCPMNLQTILCRKSAVLTVGGFQDWFCEEDYYLWIRLILAGKQMANLGATLCYVRVGIEMYQRRGGWKYFKSERGIQRYMWQHHLITYPRYCYNVFIRFLVQVAMPNKMRGWVFRTFARE